MSEGQYESDKAIHAVSNSICPKPHAWGRYERPGLPTYFLLADFREIVRLPTGKFGFHTTTCHGKAAQLTDCWEDSWEVLYRKQLAHVFEMDKKKHPAWPDFEFCAQLVLDKCVPRLLGPLQSEGREIKPCLVHGNIWDQNTATDMETGEPFVFDGSAFHGHNEYELGNWRTPRHRLSKDDWDSRNLLYSLRFNVTAATLIPGSNYREHVFEDLKELCRRICPQDLADFKSRVQDDENDLAEEEEEEEEEEEKDEDEDQEE